MSQGQDIYCAIKVDLVRSSDIKDFHVPTLIRDCIKALKKEHPNTIISSDLGLGDEFEILLGSSNRCYDIIDHIFYFFYRRDIKVYCGAGLGSISTQISVQSREMAGDVFIFADKALQKAKNSKIEWKRIQFHSENMKYGAIVSKINFNLEQIFSRRLDLTKQQERILFLRKRMSGKEVAKEMKISGSAVSQSLKRSNYRLILKLEEEINNILLKIEMSTVFSMGCGLYFYPPIYYENTVDIFSFEERRISLTSAGFLSVDAKDTKTSLDVINSIFLSYSLLKSKGVFKAIEGELECRGPSRTGTYLTPRTFLIEEEIDLKIREIFDATRRHEPLKKREFMCVIDLAKVIFNSKYRTGLFAYYDCYTRFQQEDYIGSILMSRITLEYFLSIIIEKNQDIKNRGSSKELGLNWGTNEKIAFIRENKKEGDPITVENLTDFALVADTANRIVHSVIEPTGEWAKKCQLIADKIMLMILDLENIDLMTFKNDIQAI